MTELVLSTGEYSGATSNLRQVEGVIIGTTSYLEGSFNTEFHSHSNPHISFILQGGNIENRKQITIERTIGDIMFFHSGELHKTLPATPSSKNMNLELESHFLNQNNITENDISLMMTKSSDSKFLILKMYKELLEDDHYSNVSIQILLLSSIAKKIKGNQAPIWIKRLTEFLNDEWNKHHSLSDLSHILKIHPVNISKYFTKYYGCTLGEYMRKLKIDKSLSIMQNSSLSLTEIAMICGFSDQSHFTRNFKKFTGHLPKEFRKI